MRRLLRRHLPMHRRRYRRAQLGGGNVYLLQHEFNGTYAAGSVHGILPDVGDPVVVTDTDGDALSIGSEVLSFANPNASWGNPGLWYGGIAREAGRVLVIPVTVASGSPLAVGWDTNQATIPAYGFNLAASSVLKVQLSAGAAITVGAWSTGTEYKLCVVERASGFYPFIKGGAFTAWTLLYPASGGSDATLYAAIANNNAVFTATFTRVPAPDWLPQPLCYDSFARANGAIGTSETTGPDGAAGPTVTARVWTGATWTVVSNEAVNTPTTGANTVANGDFSGGATGWNEGAGWAVAAEQGDCDGTQVANSNLNTQASGPTLGVWYQASVDIVARSAGQIRFYMDGVRATQWHTTTGVKTWTHRAGGTGQFYCQADEDFVGSVDDCSRVPITLSTLFASVEPSTADVVASVEIDTLATEKQAGMVLNLDDDSNPQNFVVAYYGFGKVRLDKCVAGTYTEMLGITTGEVAGATAVVVKDGTSYSLYYNNAKMGATVTIADAGIVDNMLHGMFSTHSENQLDNFLVLPRTGGNYPDLDQWSGVNP